MRARASPLPKKEPKQGVIEDLNVNTLDLLRRVVLNPAVTMVTPIAHATTVDSSVKKFLFRVDLAACLRLKPKWRK